MYSLSLQHCCSGDFSVVFNPDGDEDRNCSVFHILEQACFELAEVSYKINNSRIAEVSNLSNGHRPLYRNFLYSRMLWGKGGEEGCCEVGGGCGVGCLVQGLFSGIRMCWVGGIWQVGRSGIPPRGDALKRTPVHTLVIQIRLRCSYTCS